MDCMRKISDLLAKFTKLAKESDDAKLAVIESVSLVGIKITDIAKVSIKGRGVKLPLTPSQKSEVFLKQGKIIAELAKNPLTKHITKVY